MPLFPDLPSPDTALLIAAMALGGALALLASAAFYGRREDRSKRQHAHEVETLAAQQAAAYERIIQEFRVSAARYAIDQFKWGFAAGQRSLASNLAAQRDLRISTNPTNHNS